MLFFKEFKNRIKILCAVAIIVCANVMAYSQTIPIIVDDTIKLCVGTTVTLDVLLNDINDLGEIVEVDILAGPSSDLIDYEEIFPEGNYEITIDPAFIGNDLLIYEVCGEVDELCAIGFIVIIVSGADNCVWPGDANTDSICNYVDLLPIGVYYGLSGPVRDDADGSWEESFADEWPVIPDYFLPVNAKFADCNGDGIVDALDTVVIVTNYGQLHGEYLPDVFLGGPDDPAIGVDFFADTIEAGAEIIIPITFGTDAIPATNIYGLAFELVYVETLIVPGSVKVTFNYGWLGTPDIDLISLQSNDTVNGIISVSVTRINQTARSGVGHVAELSFVMEDNIAGKMNNKISSPVHFCINYPQTVNNFGAPVNINPLCDSIVVSEVITSIDENLQNNFSIFPNPADDHFTIYHRGNTDAIYSLRNTTGQIVWNEEIDAEQKIKIETNHLPSGTYILSMQTKNSVFTEKIIIQH